MNQLKERLCESLKQLSQYSRIANERAAELLDELQRPDGLSNATAILFQNVNAASHFSTEYANRVRLMIAELASYQAVIDDPAPTEPNLTFDWSSNGSVEP
jgi:hypothetical protein